MQPASAEGSNSDTGRALRRYGPIAAIAVVALVVIGVVIAGGGEDAAAPVATGASTEPAPTDATIDGTADGPATTDGEPATTDGEPGTTPDTGRTRDRSRCTGGQPASRRGDELRPSPSNSASTSTSANGATPRPAA